MKKILLLTGSFILMNCAGAYAEQAQHFDAAEFGGPDGTSLMMTEPVLAVKVGGSVHNDGARNTTAVTLELQEKECYHKAHCFNGSLTWLFSQGAASPFGGYSPNINIGAGIDYKYNVPKNQLSGIFITAGPVAFIRGLRGDDSPKINFHAGIGVEVRRFLVSFDAYGDPLNLRNGTPLYLLSGGYRF